MLVRFPGSTGLAWNVTDSEWKPQAKCPWRHAEMTETRRSSFHVLPHNGSVLTPSLLGSHALSHCRIDAGDNPNTEDIMSSPQIYLFTLNSVSHQALRFWTGKSLHTLRYGSVKQIHRALRKVQKHVDVLQASMRLVQLKAQFASVSAASVRERMKPHHKPSRKSPTTQLMRHGGAA